MVGFNDGLYWGVGWGEWWGVFLVLIGVVRIDDGGGGIESELCLGWDEDVGSGSGVILLVVIVLGFFGGGVGEG